MLVNVFVPERERERKRERERPWYKRQEKVRKAKRSLEAADWLCIFSISESMVEGKSLGGCIGLLYRAN